jgi:hypothetical protein
MTGCGALDFGFGIGDFGFGIVSIGDFGLRIGGCSQGRKVGGGR